MLHTGHRLADRILHSDPILVTNLQYIKSILLQRNIKNENVLQNRRK